MTDLEAEEDEERRAAKLTTMQRIVLLERDARSHARSITQIVESVQKGFTPAQIKQLRTVLREELADVGLRIDGQDHIDDAREDFRFLRRLRKAFDGTSRRVGSYILITLFAIGATIVGLGFWTWISRGIR